MDKYISKALLSGGVWEPYITPLFVKALTNSDNLTTVIDVGANIGYYSLLSASLGRRALAIEPSITNIRHIQEAVRKLAEPAAASITVLHNAILDTRRKVTLTSNPDNQGGLWVEPVDERSEGDIRNNTAKPIIDSILMDDLLTLLSPGSPVIIKVDIGKMYLDTCVQ